MCLGLNVVNNLSIDLLIGTKSAYTSSEIIKGPNQQSKRNSV